MSKSNVLLFTVGILCLFTIYRTYGDKKADVKITDTIHYQYDLPEEISLIKQGQRLYCDSVVTKGDQKTIYLSFDNHTYFLEFGEIDGYATMTDNNRLIYNFDSTSSVYKVMEKDNE